MDWTHKELANGSTARRPSFFFDEVHAGKKAGEATLKQEIFMVEPNGPQACRAWNSWKKPWETTKITEKNITREVMYGICAPRFLPYFFFFKALSICHFHAWQWAPDILYSSGEWSWSTFTHWTKVVWCAHAQDHGIVGPSPAGLDR